MSRRQRIFTLRSTLLPITQSQVPTTAYFTKLDAQFILRDHHPSKQWLGRSIPTISQMIAYQSLYGENLEKIYCNFPAGKFPTLEKIAASFGNKLAFGSLREIKAPKASSAKKVIIRSEISFSIGPDGTPYIYAVNGSTTSSYGKNNQDNRCALIGNRTSKENKKLSPSDNLKIEKSSVGYMSVWGKDLIGLAVYATIERTGDYIELNCLGIYNVRRFSKRYAKQAFWRSNPSRVDFPT